jgi:transposase, IS30 family
MSPSSGRRNGAPPPSPGPGLERLDQGKELALHQQITELIGTKVYFCDAHSPWQRGTNENMNGLLRDYFPKRTDLRDLTAEELQAVADEVNTRPRKSLGWARPADLFADIINSVTA